MSDRGRPRVFEALPWLSVVATILIATAWPHAAVAEAGAWRERSQLVWDATAGKLVRKTLAAWDHAPELGLVFLWESDGGSVAEGPISGAGRLVWMAYGAPAYDRTAIRSEYTGEMRNGRPQGTGKLFLADGTSYAGLWDNGLPWGKVHSTTQVAMSIAVSL